LDSVRGAKYFSTLDAPNGFWQIPMEESLIEKTGFVTKFGTYEFLTMPFGLTSAPDNRVNAFSYIEPGKVRETIEGLTLNMKGTIRVMDSVPEAPMERIWSLSTKTDLTIFEGPINGKRAHILLDSGATRCFVSTKFIETHKITPERLDTPEKVSVANGKILDITEQARLSFKLEGIMLHSNE